MICNSHMFVYMCILYFIYYGAMRVDPNISPIIFLSTLSSLPDEKLSWLLLPTDQKTEEEEKTPPNQQKENPLKGGGSGEGHLP